MDESCEILMVECDGAYLVNAPAFRASIGGFVAFNNGMIGTIIRKAFRNDDEIEHILTDMFPVYNAEKLYDLAWEAPNETM